LAIFSHILKRLQK